jgi:hypothetical protein
MSPTDAPPKGDILRRVGFNEQLPGNCERVRLCVICGVLEKNHKGEFRRHKPRGNVAHKKKIYKPMAEIKVEDVDWDWDCEKIDGKYYLYQPLGETQGELTRWGRERKKKRGSERKE